jgi:hypothetical protein
MPVACVTYKREIFPEFDKFTNLYSNTPAMKKKIIFLFAFSVLALNLSAQFGYVREGVGYECSRREYHNWNQDEQKYSDFWDGFDEESSFRIDEKKGVITHVTPTMESEYYIAEQMHDAKGKMHIYSVVSNANNEYVYWFDDTHKRIYVFAEGDDDIPYRLTFKISKVTGRK